MHGTQKTIEVRGRCNAEKKEGRRGGGGQITDNRKRRNGGLRSEKGGVLGTERKT